MIEFQIQRHGILFILSAPSGGGKSTILRALLKADDTLSYSVSATSRKPRAGEANGREYYFLTEADFEKRLSEGAFLEHARVHGNYYGTLRDEVDAKLAAGKDLILDVDVQGSLELKKVRPEVVSIFILPPSIATLEKRLRSRGLDDEDTMRLRLQNARNEIRYAQLYDYVLVNADLLRTIEGIKHVIEAERCRAERLQILDALGQVEFLTAEPVAH